MAAPMIFREHFQVAYVIRDVDLGMGRFETQFGIGKWQVMDMLAHHGPEAAATRIAVAYAGNVVVELIEPNADVPSIYTGWTLGDPDVPRFHHHGFLSFNEADFSATVAQLEAQAIPCAGSGSFGDALDFHYADTRAALGHYCEFIHLKSAGRAFLDAIPRN